MAQVSDIPVYVHFHLPYGAGKSADLIRIFHGQERRPLRRTVIPRVAQSLARKLPDRFYHHTGQYDKNHRESDQAATGGYRADCS